MKLQGRNSVIVSAAALLFVWGGMVGLALLPDHLPGDVEGTRVVHAASCSGGEVSSPYSGPVGAAIAVCGSGWSAVTDGTPVCFGYGTAPNCDCNHPILQGDQQ